MAKTETLEDESKYHCEICSKLVEKAKKRNGIYTLPPILVFCLQRFRGGAKNQDTVEFPIKDLNMAPYLKSENHGYQEDEMLYDLYAVVNHLGGTLNSGHYIADCYDEENGSWYNFNDTTVTKVVCADDAALKKRLCSGNNYVLFYKRRGFKCETNEDFEALRVEPTGKFDDMIKVVEVMKEEVKKEEPKDENAVMDKTGKHKLVYLKEKPKSYNMESIDCDCCNKKITFTDGFWNCEETRYDICDECYQKKLEELKKSSGQKAMNADLP